LSPQIIDVLRQTTPWIDLTFHEFLVLEHILSISVRQMVLAGNWTSHTITRCTGVSRKTVTTAIRRLRKQKILIPTSNGDVFTVNCYGLVAFFIDMLVVNRPIGTSKQNQFESLLQNLSKEWEELGLDLVKIENHIPEMTERPESIGPLYKGSRKLRRSYLRIPDKLLISASCMEIALSKLSRFSELAVFMRILDLTVGQGKFQQDLVTLNIIQYGQAGLGTIGLPVSRRRIELALKSLRERGFIRIEKKNKTNPLFSIALNAPGLSALNAKERRTWDSLSVFWLTRALYANFNVTEISPIDGHHIWELAGELFPNAGNLLEELHLALGSAKSDVQSYPPWVMGTCPLAHWTHENGTDDHPSFGISLGPKGELYYHCFTCSEGKVRSIKHLLTQLEEMSGEYNREAAGIARFSRIIQNPWYGHQPQIPSQFIVQPIIKPNAKPTVKVMPLPVPYVETFPLLHQADTSIDIIALKCQQYLNGRGISSSSWERFGVRYVSGWGNPVLIFPYTDVWGNVFVLGARDVSMRRVFFVWNDKVDKSGWKINFAKLSQCSVFFGLHKIDPSSEVVVVEGECDALKLVEYGYNNVIASGRAALTKPQLEVLKAYNNLILGFDSDLAGKKAVQRVASFLIHQNQSPPVLKTVDWSLAKRQDGTPCKDPGDLDSQQEADLVMGSVKLINI